MSFARLACLLTCLLSAQPVHAAPPDVCGAPVYRGQATTSVDPAQLDIPNSGSDQPIDRTVAARLDQALEKARQATGAPSITAAILAPGRGSWSADWPASAPGLHTWASAGKAFTAASILQLVEEGKLGLDDSLSLWYPDAPFASQITIRMLLDHTSGLYSANEDPDARTPSFRLTPQAAIEIARKNGSYFCPGADWRYSNTGYALLGGILGKIDGAPFPETIQRRIISTLGPTKLRALASGEDITDIAPAKTSGDQGVFDPRTPGSAGAIVGDARSMIAFEEALLTGRLVKPKTLARMYARLYPMFDQPGLSYGLGVMAYRLPPDAKSTGAKGDLWLGHSGGAPGVKAVVAYSTVRRAYVAVALSGDGSAEATANLLLHQLDPQ